MVCILRPPSRDQGNWTRERQQKTLAGLRESFLAAAPGLKAHLEAEPSARPVPLPGHCRLPPRLVLPAQVEMMASTQQHSLVRLVGAALHTKQSARNPMLLEQHCPPRDGSLAVKDLLPGSHLVDAGYVDSEHLVASVRDYGVTLIGPAPKDQQWQARTPGAFTLQDFRLDWDQQVATCPAGHPSQS